MVDGTPNPKSSLPNTYYYEKKSQDRKHILFAFITLFITIFAIYGNTFQVPFHFDDYAHIVYNKKLHLTELTFENIEKTFSHYRSQDRIYRPVVYFSFALNYFFGRDSVTGFHWVNITIHLISSLFLFLFILNTLKLPSMTEKFNPNAYLISLLATFMWATHPIQTQAVTYIVQRMTSMAGMFYIIAMYFYLKGRTSNQVYVKTILFFLCFLSTMLALGSKENAIMLPLGLMLYDLILIQGISRKNIKNNIILFVLFIFITAGFGLLVTNGNPFAVFGQYQFRPFSLTERVLTESRVVVLYISLLLYPVPTRLNLAHDIIISSSLMNPVTTFLSILLIGSIIAVAIFISVKRPLISFCILFFFLNHIVESTLLPLELIYEHRNYVPSMLFFVPLAILFVKSMDYFSYKKSMQKLITTFTILVIVGQGHATYIRNEVWKSEGSLWFDSVTKSPYLSRPHMNLGKFYFDQGLIGKAILENKLALKLNRYTNTTNRIGPHLNLITCYLKINDFDNVIKHCTLAQKINPNFSGTYDDMAFALMEKGKLNAAYDAINKSIAINNNNALAYHIRGRILLKQRYFHSAIVDLKKALVIDPNLTEAIIDLALAYMHNKEYARAIRYFKLALSKSPHPQTIENIYVRLGLLEVYALTGNEKALKNAASNLIRSISKESLLNIIRTIYQNEKNGFALMDTKIILSEIGKAYEKEGEDLSLR